MVSFNDLPPELRLKTLEFVISSIREDVDLELTEFPLYHGIGKYAVVNREWQAFIESVNFRRIMLDEWRLSEFDTVFGGDKRRRMNYVSHISLELALPEPDEVDKWTPEDKILKMQTRNSEALTRVVWKLFKALTRGGWKLETTRSRDEADGCGVTLEIVLVDEAHITDGPMHPDSLDTEHEATRLLLDDDLKVAIDRKMMFLPTLDFVRRLCLPAFGKPALPPKAVLLLANRLKGLTHLVFERPGDSSDILARHVDSELATILDSLPGTIKCMSFFEEPGDFTPLFATNLEDVEEYLREEEEGDHYHDCEKQPRVTTIQLVQVLLRRSLSLEKFALSFWVDAVDFLHPFMKSAKKKGRHQAKLPVWPNLHTLTLTSFCFRKHHHDTDLNRVLVAAARAALRMPKLRTLEIYNVKRGRVDGMFRYTTGDKASVIKWESPWPFQPSEKVHAAWSQVARKYTRHDIRCDMSVSVPGSPYFDRSADAVPLHGLATRTTALYEISALEYSRQWISALEDEEQSETEDEDWETASDSDAS